MNTNLFEKYNIILIRKDIKNFILRIKNNLEISLSVPLSATDEDIDKFLSNKEYWIQKEINKFSSVRQYDKINLFCEGGEVRILGRQYRISVKISEKNNIFIYDNQLIIETNDIDNIKKQYENYYKKEAIKCFNERLNHQYNIVGKYGIEKPNIKIKKMKNIWGSYTKRTNTILLNYYLYTAPIYCIDYVILHELTHTKYYNHSEDFYLFLTFYMPDWKVRKKELDYNYSRYL